MSDIDKENNKEFQKLETLINETYGAKAREPMPHKTKKLIESYQKKTSFKLFGIIGLAPLAAFGWLGTLSLGSLQLIGYMAVTQAPQVVFRGSDLEDNLNFEILNIGDDNCITFSYSLPDTDAKTTQTKCLVSD